MKSRSTWALVLLAVALPLLLSACGKKRPPVVTTHPPARPASPAPSQEPWPTGPDVRPVDESTASGEDFSVSDASGEGGPLADIHFDYDQASLTDEARAILEKHALWLQSHRAAKVMVEGHCDERGTAEYNLALGERRASAVRAYLTSLGVGADRVTVVSKGKEQPFCNERAESCYSQNRRGHFLITAK